MRFDYVFDTSEKSITSFFSENVLSGTRICFFLVAACLVLFWPWHPSFEYISVKGTPLTFPVVFIFSLIWVSHFLLGCGKGEYLDKEILLKYKNKTLYTHEQTLGLFAYSLPGFVFHTLLVHLLLLPFYMAAAAVSGISRELFVSSLLVLLVSSLLARVIGFFSYLVFGLWKLTGFVCSRLLFAAFFFLSGLIFPAVNPVYIIFRVFSCQVYGSFSYRDVLPFMTAAVILIVVFVLACQFVLLKQNVKRAGINEPNNI